MATADKQLVSANERAWSGGMAGKRAVKQQQDERQAAPDGAAAVVLPADCRIAAQAALKTQLLGALEHGASVVLDASQVERVDTAALQLLVLLRRELQARGGALDWRGASEAFNEAAGLLGLARILELPAAGPA
ncbi:MULTISPECIES: STAS domain-containing protein [Rhodanobacter]|nr:MULTISPECIES: STAS domain-containing protein [Rhodanobacter]UJJ50158.1 STAS domain-containing protein [Rhodanobacter denitrificans]UJJ57656.1 STAS domain-containing protein [Rhodanobacter denitrificans]UJM85436.1 STAS domain-containing protein [Rhodanobacter denitrificans]UJM92873.1 STAS domain-containing protein [Rhodanobacter denitrificans]UJM96403.1 STAS domain-containing protein [Rhodanobacter denitrificans]